MKTLSLFVAFVMFLLITGPSGARADGNIDVSVTSEGSLKIEGVPALSQLVWVSATPVPGQLLLQTDSETTLNGVNPLIVDGVTGGISIFLDATVAVVFLTEDTEQELLINGNLEIDLSTSELAIVLLDAIRIQRDLVVNTGKGDDSVTMWQCLLKEGSASIDLGKGNDVFSSLSDSVAMMSVDGGEGDDFLFTAVDRFGLVEFHGGKGNDHFGLDSSRAEFIMLDGGPDHDLLKERRTFHGVPTVITGIDGLFSGSHADLYNLARTRNGAFDLSVWLFLFARLYL